jgi:CRISPR-associated exonuclease Cas4
MKILTPFWRRYVRAIHELPLHHLRQIRANTLGRPYGENMTDMTDPIPISALEHFAYCPRQCALIHVEQVWSENIYTMRGRDVHERVHDDSSCELAGVRLERSLPLWCRRLGLTGKGDMVEFHGDIPYPVEYKSGRRRRGNPETLQLCAQAICLEEMFGMTVPKGAIFWHGSRERQEIVFTDAMREQVAHVTLAVREMLALRITPPPVNDKRCDGCSLKESCLPGIVAEKQRITRATKGLFDL